MLAGFTAILLMPWLSCSPASAFTREQAAKGAETFRLQCARCHGPNGQGVTAVYKDLTAPPLIGPGALPKAPRPYQRVRHFDFLNVRDVYEFASSVMPLDQPASLYDNDYWDVIAYILDSDGFKPDGKELNADTAENIKIGTIDKEEVVSRYPPQAKAPSSPASLAKGPGIVGAPANPMQQGPSAVVVGEPPTAYRSNQAQPARTAAGESNKTANTGNTSHKSSGKSDNGEKSNNGANSYKAAQV
jgi:mono/diheme cytochrome c family protein